MAIFPMSNGDLILRIVYNALMGLLKPMGVERQPESSQVIPDSQERESIKCNQREKRASDTRE